MKLSKHFSKSEFECKCGCGEEFEVDKELLILLDNIREMIGTPITVTSGYRCKKHNDSVGSNERSQHRKGTAADLVVDEVPPTVIANIAEYLLLESGGIGRYETFTHVDVRDGSARWGKN